MPKPGHQRTGHTGVCSDLNRRNLRCERHKIEFDSPVRHKVMFLKLYNILVAPVARIE